MQFTPKQIHEAARFNLTTLRKASLAGESLRLDADEQTTEGGHRRYSFADLVRVVTLEHMMHQLRLPMSVSVPAVNALSEHIAKSAKDYPTQVELDSSPLGPIAVFTALSPLHVASRLTIYGTVADFAADFPFKAGIVINIAHMVYFAFVASSRVRGGDDV